MDSPPNTNSFGIGEAGKPSPMAQRNIHQQRQKKPLHEPNTLSSDNDNAAGGVSLLSYIPEGSKPTTAVAARRATIVTDVATSSTSADTKGKAKTDSKEKGHKPSLSMGSVLIQRPPLESHTARVGGGDPGSAASKADHNSGGADHQVKKPDAQVKKPKITDYFTPIRSAGKPQKQATKPSVTVKSNLTASAKAFVPKSVQQDAKDAAPKLPGSTSSPQLRRRVEVNKLADVQFGNMELDNKSSGTVIFRPEQKGERGDPFVSQSDDSRPANSDGGYSTPTQTSIAFRGSRPLFGSASPIEMSAMPSTVTALPSPTRGRGPGYTGNGLLDAVNSSSSQRSRSGSVTRPVVHQQQQPQGPSASVASWVKHRVANNSPLGPFGPTTQTGDKHGAKGNGTPTPPLTAMAGQSNQVTPVRSTQMMTAHGGQNLPTIRQSPSRLHGLGGRDPFINPTIKQVQHRRATSKATEEDLAKCREHLVKFATQSPLAKAITATADATACYSPTRFEPPPSGYRAGLPGSASEGALFKYTKRQPITPTPRGNDNANNTVKIAPALAPAPSPVATGYSAINDDVVVFRAPTEEVRKMRSPELNELVGASGVPSIRDLRGPVFPFEPNGGSQAKRGDAVIHFCNVPFDLHQSNIMAVLGKMTKVLHPILEGIHITMDNVTGKTGDAYVELLSMKAAMDHVERFRKRQMEGQIDRLGDRAIEMEISSPDALRKAVFKIGSTGIEWRGSSPTIKDPPEGQEWGHFKTLVPHENLTMLVKHAETQTNFGRQAPERPYECIISILVLMPWDATHLITIKTRREIYETVVKLLKLLQKAITTKKSENRLTPQLLSRLAKSAMLCPGFTPLMKDNIAFLASISQEDACRGYNQPRYAHMWLHQYGLVLRPGVPLDVVEYYIAIIREETTRVVDEMSMGQRRKLQKVAEGTDGYWGYFWRETKHPRGPEFDNMTLAKAGERELDTIDAILQRAIAHHANRGCQLAAARNAAPPSLRSHNHYELLGNISPA